MKLVNFQMREAIAERNGDEIIALASDIFDKKEILSRFSPRDITYYTPSSSCSVTVCLGFAAYQWIDGEISSVNQLFNLYAIEVRG